MKHLICFSVLLLVLIAGFSSLAIYLVSSTDSKNMDITQWENIPVCPMLNQPQKETLAVSGIIRYCGNCKRDYIFGSETHFWISKAWVYQK